MGELPGGAALARLLRNEEWDLRVPKPGGPAVVLAQNASDVRRIFFATSGDVRAVATCGGPVEIVGQGVIAAGPAVDPGGVTWITTGPTALVVRRATP